MLQLQEILYFKELGFKLSKIKTLLQMKNITKASMLSLQKKALGKEIQRLQRLEKSLDKTIEHYRRSKMTTEEIASQFQDFQKKLEHFENLAEEKFGEGTLDKANTLIKAIDPQEVEAIGAQSIDLMNRLVDTLKKGLAADDSNVQELMREHYEISKKLTPMTKESYLSSRELLKEGASYYRTLDPRLPEFLFEAMGVFADTYF